MVETKHSDEMTFDTSKWYAIFSGWLILPAIFTLLIFIGAIIMVTFRSPSQLSGFDLVIYYADLITIPYLIITYIFWFLRKKAFPYIMIGFFILLAGMNIAYFISGYQLDPVNLLMSIVWIIYFIRSKRVKATFTK